MAIDRFIYWKRRGPRPSVSDVRTVLQDYLGDAASKVAVKDRTRVIAELRGDPRFPFRRMPGYEGDARSSELHGHRWIEVYVAADNIDVITRMADEYTNVVADGFATLAARFWEGKREPV